MADGQPEAKRSRPGKKYEPVETPSCNGITVPEALPELQTHTTMSSHWSALELGYGNRAGSCSTGTLSSISFPAPELDMTMVSPAPKPPPSVPYAVSDAAALGVTSASAAAGMNGGDGCGAVEAPAAVLPAVVTTYGNAMYLPAAIEHVDAAAEPAKGASASAASKGNAGGTRARVVAWQTAASVAGARNCIRGSSTKKGISSATYLDSPAQTLSSEERQRTRWERALLLLQGQRLPDHVLRDLVAAMRMELDALQVDVFIPKLPPGQRDASPATAARLAIGAQCAAADAEWVAETGVKKAAPAECVPPNSPTPAKPSSMNKTQTVAPAAAVAVMAAATLPALSGGAITVQDWGSPVLAIGEEGKLEVISSGEIAWKWHLCRVLERFVCCVEMMHQARADSNKRSPGGSSKAAGSGSEAGGGGSEADDNCVELWWLQQLVASVFAEERLFLAPLRVPRRRSKRQLCRSNVAHLCCALVELVRSRFESLFGTMCMRLTAALHIHRMPGPATPLRDQLNQFFNSGKYRDYQVLTKAGYNELIGQKRLWVAEEREALLEQLCTREVRIRLPLSLHRGYLGTIECSIPPIPPRGCKL